MINIKFEFLWRSFPWKQFREKLYLIQNQIFNFIKYRNFKKALGKQTLLLFSLEVYSLAIKEITQLRLDRKIPGADHQLIRSDYKRLELLWLLQEKLHYWVASITRKVYLIDFLKGNTLCCIPTIEDRIVQHIWKLVLEPVFNSLFFGHHIFLSSIHTFLFIKYSVVIKLMSELQFPNRKLIHLKWNNFSSFKLIFNSNYLLKITFFPDSYKKPMLKCVRLKMLLDRTVSNENLQCYLHMFQYFIITFSFFGLRYLYLRDISLTLVSFSNLLVLGFCYFNEILYVFDTAGFSTSYFILCRTLRFQKNLLNAVFFLENKNQFLGFDFLDWHFKVNKAYICRLVPNSITWVNYKAQFKRILKSNKYTIYQRMKFLILLNQIRIANNWFCSTSVFKKEFYVLKISFNKYVQKCTNLSKDEKSYFLKYIFKT